MVSSWWPVVDFWFGGPLPAKEVPLGRNGCSGPSHEPFSFGARADGILYSSSYTRNMLSHFLEQISSYLLAFGAPAWERRYNMWVSDFSEVALLQARLHHIWWSRPLRLGLPTLFPRSYHAAWGAFPHWQGGVPQSLLIATDGSGTHGGSWAFIAWAYDGSVWHRMGWDSMTLAATPWASSTSSAHSVWCSYDSELAALQAAAIWCLTVLDQWQLWTRASPTAVTIVIDNAAALQVAAGQGAATGVAAQITRVLWQAVQSRVSTIFRHVHSHVGVLTNTLVDALAGLRLPCPLAIQEQARVAPVLGELLTHVGAYLWLLPRARFLDERPCLCIPDAHIGIAQHGDRSTASPNEVAGTTPESAPAASPSLDSSSEPVIRSVTLNIVTAHVQTMKDAKPNLFNPSGHAARRQSLLHQVERIPCDVFCVQEARSSPGRWSTGGWLSWCSGHLKGQYGCEVWIRPSILDPPLTLQSWRILVSEPRILLVTCTDPRLPISVCSAHAPHADRPAAEATTFWQDLKIAILRAPSYRGVVLGLDANADFFAPDDDGVLIGDLTAAGEPGRNDMHLLEFCMHLGLEAPATRAEVQVGPGWSWEHTGGTRKRIDHILFQAGPWDVQATSQALDLDLGHLTRDHMPLRAKTCLHCPRPPTRPQGPRRCTAAELLSHGAELWHNVRAQLRHYHSPDQCVGLLIQEHGRFVARLPKRPPFTPRQPYLAPATVVALGDLRDWRQQLRIITRTQRLCCLQVWFSGWRNGYANTSDLAARRDSRRLLAAFSGQERRLSRKVHELARRDKAQHFLALTQAATDLWHSDGRPMEALTKLRWASRKAAEKRAVFAAGGYDIDAQLEEQFRAQEAGRRVNDAQIVQEYRAWVDGPPTMCSSALPTLLQLEHLCRRQKAAKAPGPDLILNELWRGFPAYSGQWFWQVCTLIALTGHEPLHFKLALLCALYKKGPAALPNNYRSIALLNGMAKVWHSHLRSSVGQSVLRGYGPFQLGGRKQIPVSFAVAAYRCAADLSHAAGRSIAVLFVDIQAAYYEASRQLVFTGGDLGEPATGLNGAHLTLLAQELLSSGALEILGVPAEERALLQDCVECSHWRLVSSSRTYAAMRGSRPGDGLADILFGALFSVALRHIQRTCQAEGLVHRSIGSAVGTDGDLLQLGWADDLAVVADFDTPSDLQTQFPRIASIAISTLQAMKFRVNLGAGKTEALLDIRGPQAKRIRGEMLLGQSTVVLAPDLILRVAPEYRYLGVVQTPHDTGRRDMELCARRACSAWAHGRNLLAGSCLPWALKTAWLSGRVLPAAYATLATSLAVSARAWSPLTGFFERAARTLVGSWRFGHFLTGPLMGAVLGLATPEHAAIVARVRLVTQLVTAGPHDLLEVFEAAWNRATPWCELLADGLRSLSVALPPIRDLPVTSLAYVRLAVKPIRKLCRRISRWGSQMQAVWDLWQDVVLPRHKAVLGTPTALHCPLCQQSLPSRHSLAAHMHRKHSVVNVMTRYTAGTICLWCHTEHHSTDRLKYHLSRSTTCLHGLRVVTGPVYSYGSGTKRTGERQHRGLPPIRLPGPVNATAAQRRAASEGRACTDAELTAELFQATGATSPHDWPAPSSADSACRDDANDVQSQAPPACEGPGPTSGPSLSSGAVAVRWFSISDFSAVAATDWHTPSPLWDGLLRQHFVIQLPAQWHRFWRIWQAMQSLHSWSPLSFRAAAVLRDASAFIPGTGSAAREPPSALLDFLAATIAFRRICLALQSGGCFWISGVPSATGLALLKCLLPSAVFYTVPAQPSPAFVVAHVTSSPSVWRSELSSLLDGVPVAASPRVLPIRASLVYRTRSQS